MIRCLVHRTLALSLVFPLFGVACFAAQPSPCERISEIRSIPMKGQGSDEAYVDLMKAGDSAVPCLIEKITDTTPMPDPRMAPKYSGTVVGDVAVFMLTRITETEFQALLPEEVKESYRDSGVYAYFKYVAEPEHREELQKRWRQWWQQRTSEE